MTTFLATVTLLTQALMKFPLIEKVVRDIIAAANKAIMNYDQAQFEKKLKEAAEKAITEKDTSDLEKLTGKKP
jgi:hypothetical protein